MRAAIAVGLAALAAGAFLWLRAREPEPPARGGSAPPAAAAEEPDAADLGATLAGVVRQHFPDRGRFTITESDAGITLLANGVSRRVVLEALGRRFGFEVAGRADPDPRLRLAVLDADLETVLRRLLSGTPHTLDRGAPAPGGEAPLVRVALGGDGGGADAPSR